MLPTCHQTLQGCKKLCAIPTTQKHPLSQAELTGLQPQYMSSCSHDDLLFFIILLVGFHALMWLGELGSIWQQKFFFSFFLIPKTPMWHKIPIRSVWLPAAWVTHHLTSCKPTVRAARGAAALPSQFPVFLLQMHLEILLLLYIVAGLLKKNELSSTFLLSMHLRLAIGASFTKTTWNQATTFMSNRFPQYTFKSDQLSGKWQRVHHFVIYQSTIAY